MTPRGLRNVENLAGNAAFTQIFDAFSPLFRNEPELLLEDVLGIDRPPARQIVVRIADHSREHTGRSLEQQIRRAHILRPAVEVSMWNGYISKASLKFPTRA